MRSGSSNLEGELPPTGEFLTVKEAATYLKATPNTITIWCRAGQIPAIKIGRQWRISKKELDRMVTRRFGNGRRSTSISPEQGVDDE